MDILVIGTLYNPDLGPSAPLFTSLCEKFVEHGHNVSVITMVPHYPTGKVSSNYRKKIFSRSCENGVNVIRIGIPSLDRKNFSKRLLQFISYQIGAILFGFGLKYEVILAANPSLTVFLPFLWFSVFRKKPAIYSVQDVYPDIGIELGIFSNPILKRIITSLECFCLKRAKIVHIISNSFIKKLINLGVDKEKMVLIYNLVDINLIQPCQKQNPFSITNHLDNYFVILYAGNLGLSQGLKYILLSAELLAQYPDIKFVFVGDGCEKSVLQEMASEMKLNNVLFMPFQPREKLSEVLASASISVVMLRSNLANNSLPSKIFSIMASERPILMCVDEDSEAWNLVHQAEAGKLVEPNNPDEIAKSILFLKQNSEYCESLGKNGRIWVEKNSSPDIVAQKFENLFSSALHY